MVTYPSKIIFLKDIDYTTRKNLDELKTYLEIKGSSYSQHSDNLENYSKKDLHYFMGNSVVRITESKSHAHIKILSSTERNLASIKKILKRLLMERS